MTESLKKPGILFKILFFLTGILSLIWFLVRVIPKPSRATYPCMKAAMPVASSFVVYLLALSGSFLFFRKAVNRIKSRNFLYAASLIIIVAALAILTIVNNGFQLNAETGAMEEFHQTYNTNLQSSHHTKSTLPNPHS
jgi:hypothetical protein